MKTDEIIERLTCLQLQIEKRQDYIQGINASLNLMVIKDEDEKTFERLYKKRFRFEKQLNYLRSEFEILRKL